MNRKDAGGYGNEVLYRMCREEPKHTDVDIISGKIWLIGRAYAAAIERGAGKSAGEARAEGKDLHEKIAAKIVDSDLDKWLESLADVKRVEMSNLPSILLVHKELVDLLAKFIDRDGAKVRDRRSFASKYLHFHNPLAFFIFDSRAQNKIGKLVQGARRIPPSCAKVDKTYADFVLRCMEYRDSLSNGERQMTPRYLDMKLLGY